MNIKKLLIGTAASAVMLGSVITASFAASQVVYDSIPTPTPGNVPSVGFEATSTSEFGGQIGLASTERTDPKVTILMSSWGCESGTWYSGNCVTTVGATFNHPITINVYNVNLDNTVGSLITTKTESFDMPYRPSADPSCIGGDAGKWSNGTTCYNGKAFPISFDLAGTTLPDKVIVSVAYNTSHYGNSPIGTQACNLTPQGCPYDSLNVGTSTTSTVGTALPTADDAYQNSTWSGAYCDNGVGGTGTFRLDAGCWTGFIPAIRVEANPPVVGPPTDKNACKNGGWQTFNNPSFKNQGACVSYITSNEKAGKRN